MSASLSYGFSSHSGRNDFHLHWAAALLKYPVQIGPLTMPRRMEVFMVMPLPSCYFFPKTAAKGLLNGTFSSRFPRCGRP